MPTRRSHHKNPQSTGSGELLGWWDRKCWEAGPPGKGLEAKQLLPHRWPCASLSPGGSSIAFILCPGKRVSLSSLCRSSKLSGGALEPPHRQRSEAQAATRACSWNRKWQEEQSCGAEPFTHVTACHLHAGGVRLALNFRAPSWCPRQLLGGEKPPHIWWPEASEVKCSLWR